MTGKKYFFWFLFDQNELTSFFQIKDFFLTFCHLTSFFVCFWNWKFGKFLTGISKRRFSLNLRFLLPSFRLIFGLKKSVSWNFCFVRNWKSKQTAEREFGQSLATKFGQKRQKLKYDNFVGEITVVKPEMFQFMDGFSTISNLKHAFIYCSR